MGPTVGKIIRVGLMGVNATLETVDFVLNALDDAVEYAKSSQLNSNTLKV